MKKFITSVKIMLTSLLVCFSLLLVISALVSVNVKNDLFAFDVKSNNSILNDTVTVHFIHGSIPQKNCDYQKKRIGGPLGGHIEIEIDDKVYGFLYDKLPIHKHTFYKEEFNSKFEMLEVGKWEIKNEEDRITSIHIPTESKKVKLLQEELEFYLEAPPFDYAFLGHRCTSASATLLSRFSVINKFSGLESIIAFFYPRTFRGALIKFAEKNKLQVSYKRGSDCHYWEDF